MNLKKKKKKTGCMKCDRDEKVMPLKWSLMLLCFGSLC